MLNHIWPEGIWSGWHFFTAFLARELLTHAPFPPKRDLPSRLKALLYFIICHLPICSWVCVNLLLSSQATGGIFKERGVNFRGDNPRHFTTWNALCMNEMKTRFSSTTTHQKTPPSLFCIHKHCLFYSRFNHFFNSSFHSLHKLHIDAYLFWGTKQPLRNAI